jgi:predicted nucleotidyltransferase
VSSASPLDAAVLIGEWLDARSVPYVIIGGLAVQHWGEPRTTRDVDLTVQIPPNELEPFAREVIETFPARVDDAVSFAVQSRVLLVSTPAGVPIDLSFGLPGYEEQVMARAVEVSWLDRPPVRVISAEDLIVHKLVAGRPRDIEDVRGILARRFDSLRLEVIRTWLETLGALLPERDLAAVFELLVGEGAR